MKIVFVLPDMGAGGAERVVSILSYRFVQEGYGVSIVFLCDDKLEYTLCDKIEKVYLYAKDDSKTRRISKIRNYLKSIRKAEQVAVLPFHDSCLKYCVCAAFGLGIPVIACERNNPYNKGTSMFDKIKSNLPYLFAQKCVFQTEDAMKYYCKAIRKKGTIIYNPISDRFYDEWTGFDSKTVVSVGRLVPQKNYALLIDAFAEFHRLYPEYCLNIYGEGSLRQVLQKKIDDYGLSGNITLCGKSKNIGEILSKARFFVLSSDYEGMSNALIEALVSGVPVISTDHPAGGARALIRNGYNGLLVPTGNVNELVRALKYFAENPDMAAEMGKKAKKIKENLTVDKIITEWEEIICKAI